MKNRNLIFFIGLLFLSCKSVPVSNNLLDFYGFVTDENNCPVENFNINIRLKNNKEKTGVTDSNGLFVINNVMPGELSVTAFKTGYSLYKNNNLSFYDGKKIFCLQVNSADAILNKVEKYFMAGDIENSNKCIEEIYCQNNSVLNNLITEYKKIINGDCNNEK